MALVQNTSVFGLASSIYRSGYPMREKAPTESEFADEVSRIQNDIENKMYNNQHIQRAIRLANATGGGHDQFLTGVVVNFDLTFSNKAWVEAERYTFLNFISSMSTMHRISTFQIGECCNQYTRAESIAEAEYAQAIYSYIANNNATEDEKSDAYLKLLYSIPAGFEITAGMTTNYRCLKNIYRQRKNHRLPEWREFCLWIESLPMSGSLITGKDLNEDNLHIRESGTRERHDG